MRQAAAATAIYGFLLLVGGIMGLVKAGSAVSLVMGVVAWVVALTAATMMSRFQRNGLWVAVGLALALASFGGWHWLGRDAAFMPRGFIFVLSLAALAGLAPALLARKPSTAETADTSAGSPAAPASDDR